ncbi:DUF3987 domain-containing protein [Streptomyces sp. NPDC048507]|uniref:DUF3987 domain-containing protein n=1 Tax=Streptomyces sp. NPDC048507 TaxID=3365560 RepID=UPI0037234A3A
MVPQEHFDAQYDDAEEGSNSTPPAEPREGAFPDDTTAQGLWLVKRGMYLHPLDHPGLAVCASPHWKTPCDGQRGKHPITSWRNAASNDPQDVVTWTAGATVNLAVDCGRSGIFVVDEDAYGEFARLCDQIGIPMPKTLTIQTADGFHYYFLQPAGAAITNAESELKDYAINIRGEGGYVVAPGSVHQSGVIYSFIDEFEAIALAPDELVDFLRNQRRVAKASAPSVSRVRMSQLAPGDVDPRFVGAIPAGSRHDALVAYAGHLRERFLDCAIDEEMVRQLYRARWQECEQPADKRKVTWQEAWSTLVDVWRRYWGASIAERQLRADERDLWVGEDNVLRDPPPTLPSQKVVPKDPNGGVSSHYVGQIEEESQVSTLGPEHAEKVPTWSPVVPKVPNGGGQSHDADDSGSEGTRTAQQHIIWDRPLPLETADLIPFPVDTLGDLQDMVVATAEETQTSPELAAITALANVAMSLGGQRVVHVHGDWYEQTVLWGMGIGDPSVRKDPVIKLLWSPLDKYRKGCKDKHATWEAENGGLVEVMQNKCVELAGKIAEAFAAGKDTIELQAELDGLRVRLGELPPEPLITDPAMFGGDITIETAAVEAAKQGGRMGLLATEATLIDIAAGAYSKGGGANVGFLLAGYSGAPYEVRRLGRENLSMDRCVVNMGLLLQPDALAGRLAKKGGMRDVGLFQRFLPQFSLPRATHSMFPAAVPTEVKDEYNRRMTSLLAHVWNNPQPIEVRPDREAYRAIRAFEMSLKMRCKEGMDLADLSSWVGKLHGQVVRLADTLMAYEDPDARVLTVGYVHRAIAMTPSFISHARAMFDLLREGERGSLTGPTACLNWMTSRAAKGHADKSFRLRDAQQSMKRQRWVKEGGIAVVEEAFRVLETLGWVLEVQPLNGAPLVAGRSLAFRPHPWVATPPDDGGLVTDSPAGGSTFEELEKLAAASDPDPEGKLDESWGFESAPTESTATFGTACTLCGMLDSVLPPETVCADCRRYAEMRERDAVAAQQAAHAETLQRADQMDPIF